MIVSCKLPRVTPDSEIRVVMSIHRYFDETEWYIQYNDPNGMASYWFHQRCISCCNQI